MLKASLPPDVIFEPPKIKDPVVTSGGEIGLGFSIDLKIPQFVL